MLEAFEGVVQVVEFVRKNRTKINAFDRNCKLQSEGHSEISELNVALQFDTFYSISQAHNDIGQPRSNVKQHVQVGSPSKPQQLLA